MKPLSIGLLLIVMLLINSCKKEGAEYINTVTGSYKMSGQVSYDTLLHYYTDTIVRVVKKSSTSFTFLRGSCDLSLYRGDFSYYGETDSTIIYIGASSGDHDPNSSQIIFDKPTGSHFMLSGDFYCGAAFNEYTFHGTKI
ncbi:MAG TPA: hypothetical protein VG603_16105 [Chitinophagales bacterium]|nr:hypothetical protein [Chitinophagales bacterium]